MMPRISRCFKLNFIFLNVFGIWPVNNNGTCYKYYSISFVFISLFVYNLLLTLNLIYAPRKLEILIREVVFYFTEIAVTGKVLMILTKRSDILNVLKILDCKAFQGHGDMSRIIIKRHIAKYKIYWKIYALISNFAYWSQILLPVALHFVFNTTLNLPICKYYFLNVQFIKKYFIYLFIYQSVWMYGHMTYNINIDTLIAGFVIMAITQLRVLNYEFKHFNLSMKNSRNSTRNTELLELKRYLKHYDTILSYCSKIQEILSVSLFVQFGMASGIICVILCGMLLQTSKESLIFMTSYLLAMTLQIFVPAYLGSILSNESEELVFAAYCAKWVPRSKEFKTSINIFLTRANRKISITALKMIPLSLDTFTWIMKTAYSFLTVIRNIQNQQN
ncbi:PREDICTED: odorant receptor 43b-like [Papilio xuthus]|uniref:Odorant receptor n=1 Tax=Papilio xuthus TaxID=66420 RepID=A0AAJ7EFT7_PAPXU|nr:PREDICTED: odorant receptor 43b-like [Papilio xuthus]WCC57680.1 odorant receptor 30 [Papilio xuthus]